jgi:hypothetical protein
VCQPAAAALLTGYQQTGEHQQGHERAFLHEYRTFVVAGCPAQRSVRPLGIDG